MARIDRDIAIYIHEGTDGVCVENDNVDVTVRLADGAHYWATFFTFSNIDHFVKKNRATGECRAGLYFWSLHMILVQDLRDETIRATIADLISTGEFSSAFGVGGFSSDGSSHPHCRRIA